MSNSENGFDFAIGLTEEIPENIGSINVYLA